MESNIKGLVAAGHEMASELKAECGAVDMRSVAKLLSDLATQLEVQLVRANALAEDQQRAIESIKQADSAVKLAHKKFSELAAENAGLKHAMAVTLEHVSVTDAGQAGVAAMIINDALHHSETPATDAFLAEIRAEAREIKPAKGEVLVVVSGFTGCGKSAIAGEIEIAMKAIGVPVKWTNGDAEKRMTGADWLTAIEMYKPTVRIVEVNVPRAAGIRIKGGE
ncbi:TPA: ead/Ea22-like family protein [Escherichia coli]|uniref:ead/Ea22-like family protein n=1 Tax=Escherichia coli TaxID=562 RepID=UPI00388F099B|nr:ead/Ea22-like family protein [Escherichia coli]